MVTPEIQSKLLSLAKEMCNGSRTAQTEFYTLLKDNFFNLCRKYSRSEFDAEEAFQKACIKINSSLSQYSGNGSFCGWLTRIFVNHAISEYRTINFDLIGLEYDNEVPDYFEEPEFFESDEIRRIRNLYNKLDNAKKTILYMRIEEDKKFNEIGKALNMPRRTACRKYNEIIREIRELNKIK